MLNAIPLYLLQAGQSGPIVDIDDTNPLTTRLNEIGIAIGETLRMVQPGSPCIVAIGEQRLSLRSEQCDTILVAVQ